MAANAEFRIRLQTWSFCSGFLRMLLSPLQSRFQLKPSHLASWTKDKDRRYLYRALVKSGPSRVYWESQLVGRMAVRSSDSLVSFAQPGCWWSLQGELTSSGDWETMRSACRIDCRFNFRFFCQCCVLVCKQTCASPSTSISPGAPVFEWIASCGACERKVRYWYLMVLWVSV